MRKYFIILFIILSLAIPALGANYYIDLDAGSDGDGSFASPWNSPSHLPSGTTSNNYRFKCGSSYSGTIVITAVGDGDYITIGSYYDNGGSPFHEDSSPNQGSLCGNAASKPKFIGSGSGSAIKTSGAGGNQYIRIDSLWVQNTSFGINVDKESRVKVMYNYVYDVARGINIGQNGQSSYCEVGYNTVDLNHSGQTPPDDQDESGATSDPIRINRGDHTYVHHNNTSDSDHAGIIYIWYQTGNAYNYIVSNSGSDGGNDTEDACVIMDPRSNHNVVINNSCDDIGQLVELHASSYNIVAFNYGQAPTITLSGQKMIGWLANDSFQANCEQNHVIHNTFYDDEYMLYMYSGVGKIYEKKNNYIVNNIFQKMNESTGYAIQHVDDSSGTIGPNYYWYNDIYDFPTNKFYRFNSTTYATAAALNAAESFATGNIETDPKLTTPGSDYTLQSDSPAIDAGGWLTTISSSTGSGTTFTVTDALFFYSGISEHSISGSSIKTEGGQTCTLTSVSYTINQLTCDSEISWINGEGVAYAYNGNKPDIGAFETGGSPPVPCENFSPADDAQSVPVNTNMTFDGQTGVDFDVLVSTSACGSVVVDANCDGISESGGTVTCNPAGDWATNTTVYWRVVADPDGTPQYFPSNSTCFEFSTKPSPTSTSSIEYAPTGLTIKYIGE